MRKHSLLLLAAITLATAMVAWVGLRGDGMDAFKCYRLTPEKFKARLEEEFKARQYEPPSNVAHREVTLKLGGALQFRPNQVLVVYSGKADAIVYRGKAVDSIKVLVGELLRKDGGGDNLKFQLFDQTGNELCVCQQQTDYNIWNAGLTVGVEFLSGRHVDESTGTMRRFLVDGR